MYNSNLPHATRLPDAISQEELYRLFQVSPNPYLILRPDSPRFTIADVNESYLAATYTEREDLIGRPLFEAFPANPADLNGPGVKDLRASLERVIRDQRQDEMGIQKYDIPRRHSRERGFEIKYWIPINTPVFSEQGRLSAILHQVKDVTEQILEQEQVVRNLSHVETEILQAHKQLKETNLQLKETQERLSLALDGSRVGIWDWDFKQDKAWWDKRFAEITGASIPAAEQSLGSITPLIHPEDRQIVAEALQAHLSNEKNFEFQLRFIRPSGEICYTSLRGASVLDERGDIARLAGILVDLTGPKSVERRMERQNAEQQALVALGGLALTGTADFQTILDTTVKMVAETLEVGFAKILRYVPEHESFFFKSVYGFDPSLVGQELEEASEAQAHYTLETLKPVVVEDIREEKRFQPGLIHHEYGLISGISTIIHVETLPYAILQADNRQKRHFTEDEVNFLQSTANLLGLVIEQRNVEARSQASNARFHRVVEGSNEGYWDWDVTTNSLYWSDRLFEMLGVTREEVGEVTYATYESRLPEEERERVMFAIAATIRDGVPFTEVFKLRHSSGEYRDFYSRAKPYFDEHGKVIRIAGMIADITEQKRLETALLNYQSKLEKSNRDLEQFAAIASHDLKAPLRKISTFCGVLEETEGKNLSEEGRDYLMRISRSSEKMQRLVNDLLTLSRVTSEARPFKSVNLRDVLLEVLADLGPLTREVGGTVELGYLGVIAGEEYQLYQMFLNLIGNALKFHRPDNPPVVQVNSQETADGYCVITVRDNGIGFDMKEADRIFEVFQRLNSALSYEGTGMGLAVVKKIVERHHGAIQVESQVGQGTTFTVSLPVQQMR